MNSMERVTLALTHKEADRVPVYPIMGNVTRKYNNSSVYDWSTNADVFVEAMLMAREDLDLDCLVTLIDLSVECDAWGQEVIFPDNAAAHPNYDNCVIKSIEDYDKIKKVDYRTSKRMMMHIEACEKLVKAANGEFPVVAFVYGPLGTLSMLRNQQNMYLDLYDDPDAVKRATIEINETLKEYCSALMDTGVAGIMIDTLFASGSIMAKDMWDEMEGVIVEELADVIIDKGGMVMIHNCGGNIYFDVQIKRMRPVAISFQHPPDDCADFIECKEKYGDQVTLIGCVDPAKAAIGTDEDWEADCKKHIDEMAAGGGFILATGCEYPSDSSLDRARSMVEIAKTYGKY